VTRQQSDVVGDDVAALEIDEQLLQAEVSQVKLVGRFHHHELEPPQMVKSSGQQDLPIVRGSFLNNTVRNSA
jgi:hypothetical protein